MNTEATVNKGGRPHKLDPVQVVAWRQSRNATIRDTARHFKIGAATVKRYTARYADDARHAREAIRQARLIYDWELTEHQAYLRALFAVRLKVRDDWHERRMAAWGTSEGAAVEAEYEAASEEAEQSMRADWEQRFGSAPEAAPVPVRVAHILQKLAENRQKS